MYAANARLLQRDHGALPRNVVSVTLTGLCCRWIDAGKFLTGFSAVGSIAIPAILYHAQVQNLSSLGLVGSSAEARH